MTLLLQGAGPQLDAAVAAAHYLDVPSSTSGASTPDQAGFAISTQTFDVRVKAALTNWNTGAFQSFASQRSNTNSDSRWDFGISTTGRLQLTWFQTGAVNSTVSSTVVTGIANGATSWVRAVQNFGTGKTDFYLSDDGTTWNVLGTQVTSSTTAMQTPGTPPVLRAAQDNFNLAAVGKCYRLTFIIAAATVIDMDFSAATPGNGPWVSGSGETWTRLGTSSVI